MESDSTVITASPLQSNDSMPPTPNSVENSSATSSPAIYSSTKQIKKEVTVLTNNQPIMTSHSNRRRHYSSASSSADEDIAIDVVNETTNKKLHNKHLNKKLNSNDSELINSNRIKTESPINQRSSLNNSVNGDKNDIKLSTKTNGTTLAPKSTTPAHTILHSPNSNSSSNSQFDTSTIKAESAASLIANLDAEQASRKFKSFLIEDILSQQRKKAHEQLLHQKFIEQQLLLQHINSNKLLQQQHSSTLPSLSPNATNQSSPNSVHSLVNNNSDNLNDSMSAALAAYNSINSIIRPWDLANGLIPNSAAAAAAAATLSQLTSAQQASLNAGQQQSNSTNATANLPTSHSLALTLGTNNLQSTNTSSTTQQQINNHLNGSSSLINNTNQLAMAAALASQQQSSNNKLNAQQLQQLRFGSLANYPHLLSGNFAASLSHLSPHHQFLAGLNGNASSLFPGLTAANNLNTNAALNAALKNDPSFRLHHPLTTHPFTNNTLLAQQQQQQTNTSSNPTEASLMQHLINNSTNNLTNGQQNKSSNVNRNKQSKSNSINENGKRLNVEDLDEDCEDYENDTIMNEDDDCDEKCSINSSTNGQNKKTNGDGSPLSALYELANKPFELTRNEKASENNPERMNTIFTNNGQASKKKRKSRTAFTNKQIYELEKKFIFQRYLTPADRDELAERLDLSGAQVITWFQNRRAKTKRDNEELSKDMQTAKIYQATMSSQFLYSKALIENHLPNIYENMQQKIDLLNAAKMHLHLPSSLPPKP